MSQRICIIDPLGGKLKITFQANDFLAAAMNCKILKKNEDGNYDVVSKWDMKKTDESKEYNFTINSNELHGKYLQVGINICSLSNQLNYGRAGYILSQDGVQCKITKETLWDIEDIPLCESGNVTELQRSILFANIPV